MRSRYRTAAPSGVDRWVSGSTGSGTWTSISTSTRSGVNRSTLGRPPQELLEQRAGVERAVGAVERGEDERLDDRAVPAPHAREVVDRQRFAASPAPGRRPGRAPPARRPCRATAPRSQARRHRPNHARSSAVTTYWAMGPLNAGAASPSNGAEDTHLQACGAGRRPVGGTHRRRRPTAGGIT